MPLHLITDQLDAYEAERADLFDQYQAAVQAGDELGIRRIEALAADHDQRHGGPSLVNELAGFHQPAAA